MSDQKYWAASNPTDLAERMKKKVRAFDDFLDKHGMWKKWQSSTILYNGKDPKNGNSADDVSVVASDGSLMTRLNLYRRMIDSAHVLVTGVRPTFAPKADGDDSVVTECSLIAGQLLDDAITKRSGEQCAIAAAKNSLLYASGYMLAIWDEEQGEERVFFDSQIGQNVARREGDVSFLALRPDQVVFDISADENSSLYWYIIQKKVNRHELASKYPEYGEDILSFENDKVRDSKYGLISGIDTDSSRNDVDSVCVYELWHERTSFLPQGRHAIMINGRVIADGPLRYKRIPIVEMSTGSRIPGTKISTSHFFDVLGAQRIVDSFLSRAVTTHDVLGQPIMWIPGGSSMLGGDIGSFPIQKEDGFVVISSSIEPKSIEFSSSVLPSSMSFVDYMKSSVIEIARLNDVALGTADASSGKHLSMAHAMAQQSSSDYQASYSKLFETIGVMILEIYKTFSTAERTISVCGRNKQTMVKNFHTSMFDSIRGVGVDVGAAVMRTAAGRKEIADMMFDKQAIDVEQYLEMISTGKLTPMTEGPAKRRILIEHENQMLYEGKNPVVSLMDNHLDHINEHAPILSDPAMRKDPMLLSAALEHLQGHQKMWTDLFIQMPDIAAALNIPPPPSFQAMNMMQQQQTVMPSGQEGQQSEPLSEPSNDAPIVSQVDTGIPSLPGGGMAPSIGDLPAN